MSNENITKIELNRGYLEFPADAYTEQARKTFQDRFGYPPDTAEIMGWRLYVGPVKDGEE